MPITWKDPVSSLPPQPTSLQLLSYGSAVGRRDLSMPQKTRTTARKMKQDEAEGDSEEAGEPTDEEQQHEAEGDSEEAGESTNEEQQQQQDEAEGDSEE